MSRARRLGRKVELSNELNRLRAQLARLDRQLEQVDNEKLSMKQSRHSLEARIEAAEAEFLDESEEGSYKADVAPPRYAPARRTAPAQGSIIATIQHNPDATYEDLAMALHGATTQPALMSTRVLISKMKKAGRISGKPGRWRVV